jgi:DNA-directed RNA polymerase specialized sigma24 family protein
VGAGSRIREYEFRYGVELAPTFEEPGEEKGAELLEELQKAKEEFEALLDRLPPEIREEVRRVREERAEFVRNNPVLKRHAPRPPADLLLDLREKHGFTVREIGTLFGVPPSTADRWLKSAEQPRLSNEDIRRGRETLEFLSKLPWPNTASAAEVKTDLKTVWAYERTLELRAKGLSFRDIAEKVERPVMTVHSWCSSSVPKPFQFGLPDLRPSPELAHTVGGFLADGYTDAGILAERIGVKDGRYGLVKSWSRTTARVLGRATCEPYFDETQHYWRIEYKNKYLARYLYLLKYETEPERLPELCPAIVQYPAHFVLGLALDGHFDKYSIEITNTNRGWLDLAKMLLPDIVSEPKIAIKAGRETVWRGRTIRTEKDCWYVRVNRRKLEEKLREERERFLTSS